MCSFYSLLFTLSKHLKPFSTCGLPFCLPSCWRVLLLPMGTFVSPSARNVWTSLRPGLVTCLWCTLSSAWTLSSSKTRCLCCAKNTGIWRKTKQNQSGRCMAGWGAMTEAACPLLETNSPHSYEDLLHVWIRPLRFCSVAGFGGTNVVVSWDCRLHSLVGSLLKLDSEKCKHSSGNLWRCQSNFQSLLGFTSTSKDLQEMISLFAFFF